MGTRRLSNAQWEKVQELFLAAVELPPAEQAGLLSASGDEPEVRAEVESLLRADNAREDRLLSAIGAEAAIVLEDSRILGSRLGDYRVVRELGRGGMGAVYLAERDDEHYTKRVAIKIVKRGMDTADVLDRFRYERQILANLDHPNIARLIDGGSTPDGRPFFVMDYVPGQTIDEYCRAQNLDVPSRLRLFLLICDAVAYAHRNLVVHRDLKPSNILVTEEGEPKLLDFGVAKLLNDAPQGALTATIAQRRITPEYASPEQVRGLAVSTTSDVYSLGAILYELLTGSRAHPITARTQIEIERAVCEAEIRRPSLLVRGLDKDLDNIVGMAMRKEPERRYASVDSLAEDIRRHLDGRPVLARQDSWAYRSQKFLQRYWVPVLAGLVFAGGLIGATASATREANLANRERIRAESERQHAIESEAQATRNRKLAEQETLEAERERVLAQAQTELAEAQRQSADRRFQQVRQLAGKFLLDFHDSIAGLPGSTEARKMVVSTGLQYYDTLVKEAQGNRDLLEEIARGYDRLGDVQGNHYYANLGDAAGALAAYDKARSIRESISDSSPAFLVDRIGGNVKRAQVLAVSGDIASAERTLQEAIALGQNNPAHATYAMRQALVNAYRASGDVYFRTGDFAQSLDPYERSLQLCTQLAQEKVNPAAEQAGIGLAHAKLAEAYADLRRAEEGLPHVRVAIQVDRQLVDADPNSIPRLRRLFSDHSILSLILKADERLGEPGEARLAAETAAQLAERMHAADPKNSTALFDVMTGESVVGDWLRAHDDPAGAVAYYRKTVDAAEQFAATGAATLLSYESLIYAHQRLASGLGLSGQLEEALQQCLKAEEYADRAERLSPGLPEILSRKTDVGNTRAQAYAKRKRWTEAIDAYKQTLLIFEELRKRKPANQGYLSGQSLARLEMADCYAATGQLTEALQAARVGLEGLERLASMRPLRQEEVSHQRDASSRIDLWKAKAAVR